MKVFVTGASGLVGSHLVVALLQDDEIEQITCLYRSEKRKERLEKVWQFYNPKQQNLPQNKIHWVKGNILDVSLLAEQVKGHDIVYHCAAMVSFQRKDFSKLMQINREGTANMVNVALHHQVKHFCYVSSTAAIGNKDIPEHELINEKGIWVNSDKTSGYALSKYSAEKEVWRGIEEGLNAVIVNPSVVIGAGNWSESSMVIFNSIKNGLKFYSPGANAFVDARDVAKIMVELVKRKISKERFLVVGHNLPFKVLFDEIAEQLDKPKPKYPVQKWLLGIAWRIAVFWSAITFSSPVITKSSAQSAFNVKKFDNSKIKKLLGYEFHNIEDTISNAIHGKLD
jgi:dihydroflavonol-4-reductase